MGMDVSEILNAPTDPAVEDGQGGDAPIDEGGQVESGEQNTDIQDGFGDQPIDQDGSEDAAAPMEITDDVKLAVAQQLGFESIADMEKAARPAVEAQRKITELGMLKAKAESRLAEVQYLIQQSALQMPGQAPAQKPAAATPLSDEEYLDPELVRLREVASANQTRLDQFEQTQRQSETKRLLAEISPRIDEVAEILFTEAVPDADGKSRDAVLRMVKESGTVPADLDRLSKEMLLHGGSPQSAAQLKAFVLQACYAIDFQKNAGKIIRDNQIAATRQAKKAALVKQGAVSMKGQAGSPPRAGRGGTSDYDYAAEMKRAGQV